MEKPTDYWNSVWNEEAVLFLAKNHPTTAGDILSSAL